MPLAAILPHNLTHSIYVERRFAAFPGRTTAQGNGITLTATGTVTAYTPATTSRAALAAVVEYLAAASASAVAGFRINSLFLARGNIGGGGGFYVRMLWRPATGQTIATHRCFVGLRGSTSAPTDVNPSTLTNIIGVGWDSGDSNIQLIHNGGSGTATKNNLGSGFPRPTADRSNLYILEMFAPRGGSTVAWRFLNLVNNAVASGTISTNLPAETQLLTLLGYASVGGTNSVIGIAIGDAHIITGV